VWRGRPWARRNKPPATRDKPEAKRDKPEAMGDKPADQDDAISALLFWSCAVPLVALLPLSLWSRAAEPHWLAPAWLALAPAAAREPTTRTAGAREPIPRGLVIASCGLAAAIVAAVHAWVLAPGLLRFAPASYNARIDIANELYGWPQVARAVREEARAQWTPGSERGDVVVVGPHWVVCAQLDAALNGEWPVGCNTPVRDDFDDWWPRGRWRGADTIVWVSDARFGAAPEMATHAAVRTKRVSIVRGGRVVRIFAVTVLMRRAAA
jgi:hypothetical protein